MSTSVPDISCRVTSNPSNVIKHFEELITVGQTRARLNLITMKRTFLLDISHNSIFSDAISNDKPKASHLIDGLNTNNTALNGLSLALGDYNTIISFRGDTHASSNLATRLSKSLNKNRPVYVSNNLEYSLDPVMEQGNLTSLLYMKIFQFVKANYIPEP